jgi:uncharacterized membrane protein YagU involved in acid resistance
MRRHPALFTIFVGGSIAGACDITYAVGFSAYRGVAPMRILQSVASGLLGPASFNGGVATAVLGLCLHFFIAFIVAAIFYLASRLLPVVLRYTAVAGIAYGAVVYAVMNLVVLPLSAAPPRTTAMPTVVMVTGLLVHMFGIGLPIALAARSAARVRP